MEDEPALRDQPLLRINVPVAQIAAHEFKCSFAPLARTEFNLVEPTELARRRAFRSTVRESDVQLGHSGAADIAGVANGDLGSVNGFP